MEERKAAFLKAAKGVCVATGATLLCMVLLALAVVFLRISDNALFLMNQLAKVASIFAGAYFAVGPGGQRQTEKEPVIPAPLVSMVAREGLEPPAQGFSVPCSTD